MLVTLGSERVKIILVIRDSQVLAKLVVVTIFFYWLGTNCKITESSTKYRRQNTNRN